MEQDPQATAKPIGIEESRIDEFVVSYPCPKVPVVAHFLRSEQSVPKG